MKKFIHLKLILTTGLLISGLYLFADIKPSANSNAPHYIFDPATTCEHPYSFKNNETPPTTAKDLHVVFDKPLQVPPFSWSPVGAFGSGNYNPGAGQVNLFGPGAGIGSGATVTVTVGFADKKCGRVLGYWWTINGSSSQMEDKNNRLGPKHGNQPKGKFDFAMVPSTGNGHVAITVDGQQHNFNIPQGVPGDVTAQLFALFVSNIPFGVVDSITGNQVTPLNKVIVYFNAFDGSTPNFTVNIVQDATQTTTFSYFDDTECIPTLSEWGLIILALLLVASGMVFIRRRNYSLAMAGGDSIAEDRKSLFNPRSFFIILAGLWIITLAVFATDKIFFNVMPMLDVIGTLVVCVILAYILHLLEAFRKE